MYLQRFKRHTAILATSLTLSVSAFVGIPTAYAQTAAWESITDLSQPESVVYDSATNLLYVSNAATDPTTGDPAGYISTVDPATGQVVTKEWLTGLGDIKGLTIHGTNLYVAANPSLVEISLTDKKVTNTYSVAEGTTAPQLLNDVSADASGNVYASDTQGNKIYCLCGGTFNVWSDSTELVSPNGILADAMTGSLVVVTTDAATKVGKLKVISTAEGKAVSTIATLDNVTLLDGLAYDEGTGYYITDFGGKLFLADETGKVTELMAGEIDFASADLTYLPAKNVLVIPIMDEMASKLVALTPDQIALNVEKMATATGTGTVTSTPGLATGINCGKDCKEATEYYAPATEVKLTATADEGSTLASWGGDCKDMTGNEVTLKMDAAKTCEVNFESTAVTNLALAITLAGNGTVKSEPAGIDCGTTCNASFAPNTAVVLTATPADDSLFKQWDGDCVAAGVATTANVTLDAAKNCTATFELKPVVAKNVLTVTLDNGGDATAAVISNDGGIKCGIADGSCTKEYDLGTVVTLSVTSTTVTLLGWSGACTGTELTTTVTMDVAKECKATFGTVTKRTLNVKMEGTGAGYVISDPAGGIDCNKDTTADCTEFYPQGTVVTLKLDDSRPLTGTTFKGWSGGCTGTDPAVQITMDADKECIATFDMLTSPFNTLTVTLAGEGKVTSDPAGIDCGTACTKDYPKDGVVTLTATITNPAMGFIGWTGDCTGTEATAKVTMDNLKNCTATFGNTIAPPIAPPPAGTTFPLTVTLQGTGLGMVTSTPAGISCGTDCTEDYAAATVVTVAAQANPGSTFAGWSGACMGAASPTTVTMDAAKSCTAAFTAAVGVSPTTPTGTVSTSVNSSTGYYDTAKALVIGTYNANGNVLKNVTIDVYANVKNAVFMGTIKNNGWISNSTIASGTTVEGGTLTGYIKNEGTISNFTFLGASITGGTLAGTILNNSKVGGAFINVTLAANAKVKGGILQGTIKGDKKAPATLENVVVKAGSHLSGVTLGANVTLGKGVVIEKDESPITPPTTPPAELPDMPSLGTALATDPTGKPIQTTAKFTGGVALNDGTTFDGEGQAKPLTDVVDLHGGITVDTAHVGKKADVFVYASYQATADDKPFHLMLDSKGAIQAWDQKVENLVAFQAGVTLSSLAEVKIYQGVLLSPGILKVHFGYRLEDGTVVETPKSIDLSVSDKKADTTGESTDREDTTDTDTEGTTDTGETDKTDTGETDKTDTGETDTTDTGKDNCGPDCSDKTDTTDTGKTDKTDTGKTDKTDTGKTDKTDTGKTDKTDTGKTDKTDTGKTDKTDTGKTDKTDTGKTDKTDTGKTDKTDTGKTDKTDTGKTDKTDTGKTDKTDTGKTDKTDTGKTDKTDTGKTDKTDTGKTDKTDTGK